MVDVARLGLAVDSSQVEKGTVSLHQLTGAAGQASAAAHRLAGASQAEAAGQKAAAAAAQAHNAALMAQNTVIRSSMQQRTMMIYQLNDVAVSLASGMNPAMVAMQQGSQILQGGLMPAIRTLVDLGKSLVVTFWPVAAVIGAVSAAVAGLTYEINKTADVQVGFFDVALAGWQLLAEQITAWVAPVFGAIGSWLQQGWDIAAPILKTVGNTIIGTFVGAFEGIKYVWSALPSVIGDIVLSAANTVVSGIEDMLNRAVDLFNEFAITVNDTVLRPAGLPLINGITGRIDLGGLDNPYEGAAAGFSGGLSDAVSGGFNQDFLGGVGSAWSKRAQEIAAARGEMDALGGSAKAANDNVKQLADDGLKSAADRAKELADNLGKSIGAGLKDLISGAKDFGQVMFDVLGSVAQFALQQSASLFGGMGGGFGFLGSILSGLFGGGFASGGYTGNGAAHEAAGIVHRGEYVFSADATRRIGVGNLEAMHSAAKGYAGGGYVSGAQGGTGSMHVTVGVSVDDEGKLQAYVKSISRQEAQMAAAAGTQVAVAQANKTAPAAVSQYQQKRAGGDYRL